MISFFSSIYTTALLTSLLSAIFIGVKILEDSSKKEIRSFFYCFFSLIIAHALFMTKEHTPDILPIFIGGSVSIFGPIFCSIGLTHLVGKTRPWYWYVLPMVLHSLALFYFWKIDYHRGGRIITSSTFVFLFLGYMFYDMAMYYKTDTKSIKILILAVIGQGALTMLIRLGAAIANFSIIRLSMNQSAMLLLIHPLFSIYIIEMGFMVLLLLADSAANKERKAAVMLSAAIEERDQLYAIVAHELSAPLNATLHMIELLKRDGARRKQPDVFDTVGGMLADLRMVLSDLLSWAKRRRSGESVEVGVVSDVAIREIIVPFFDFLEARNIGLNLSLPRKTDAALDRDLLFLAMRVLMSNAIRHGASGSRIDISLRETETHCVLTMINRTDAPGNRHTGQQLGLKLLEDQMAIGKGALSIEKDNATFTATATLPTVAYRDTAFKR